MNDDNVPFVTWDSGLGIISARINPMAANGLKYTKWPKFFDLFGLYFVERFLCVEWLEVVERKLHCWQNKTMKGKRMNAMQCINHSKRRRWMKCIEEKKKREGKEKFDSWRKIFRSNGSEYKLCYLVISNKKWFFPWSLWWEVERSRSQLNQ